MECSERLGYAAWEWVYRMECIRAKQGPTQQLRRACGMCGFRGLGRGKRMRDCECVGWCPPPPALTYISLHYLALRCIYPESIGVRVGVVSCRGLLDPPRRVP